MSSSALAARLNHALQPTHLAALLALASLVAACGSSGGGSSPTGPTGPSTTSPGDRYLLHFDSQITTLASAGFGGGSGTAAAHVVGQVALASTPTVNQFGESSGDLRYTAFSYTFTPSGGCTFTSSTTDGSITVVEASVAPANANAVRVVLRPSNTLREAIVQSCDTVTQNIPGIFWFGGWQVLHSAEANVSQNGWTIADWSPGTGSIVATKTYSVSTTVQGVQYTELTTITIEKVG